MTRRNRSGAELVVVFVGALALVLAIQVGMTVAAMFFLRWAHGMDPRVPDLAFFPTLLVGLALRFLISGVTTSSDK